jgi:uncharacterized spore protein YtfJ
MSDESIRDGVKKISEELGKLLKTAEENILVGKPLKPGSVRLISAFSEAKIALDEVEELVAECLVAQSRTKSV